jgi:hypothetical protein
MAAGVQTAAKHITGGSKMTIWMPMCWPPLIASFNVNKNIIVIYVLFIWSIIY